MRNRIQRSPLLAMLLMLGTLAGLGALYLAAPAAAQDVRLKRPTRGFRLHTTWVVTGLFNEIDQTERTEVTINEPMTLRFRWGTSHPGAEEGFWRLRGKPLPSDGGGGGGARGNARVGLPAVPIGDMAIETVNPATPAAKPIERPVLASGVATPAPGGQFEIDLGPYLPATPPSAPLVYHLEVIARTKMKIDGSVAVTPGQAGAKVPAKEIGVRSAPVVITYVVNQAPPTRFTIGDVYRKATLVLDNFILVDDQIGPGDEEYHIGGFIQELGRVCVDPAQLECRFSQPLEQRSFQQYRVVDPGGDLPKEVPMSHVLDPSYSPPIKELPHSWDFALGSGGNKVIAPRQFLLAVSLLEEDAGGSVDNWNTGLGRLQDEVEKGDILEMAESELEQFLTEHAADAIRYVADGVRMAAMAAGETAGPIGAAVAVVVAVAVSIVEDMEDDYYGTRGATLTLESNRTTDVHELPGAFVGTGSERKYVLNPQKLQFKGPPASNQAGAWDGIVEVEFHWEFSEQEQE